MNFLHIESPLMKKLGIMADLLILNLVTLVCCLPIVTAGAAFTAMHYVLLKIVRGEEGYVVKTFFRAFKENLLQGTILWIIMVIVYAALFVDWRILRMQGNEFPVFMNILLLMHSRSSGSFTLERTEQSEKTPSPISVTRSGITIFLRLSHPLKA